MNLSGLDWVIAITIIFFIYRGFRNGFVQQFFGLFGTILALIVAFHFYNELGYTFSRWLNVSENLGNIAGFILITVGISGIMGFLSMKWRAYTQETTVSVLDGVAGAIFGGVKVLLVWVMILLIISSLQWSFFQDLLYNSQLAEDVLKIAPLFFFIQDQALPSNVPRLFLTPEGLQLRKVRYEDLDQSTCLACGGVVKYQGMVKKGLFYFPKYVCTACGRVSDGCQTFEGYHLFYRRCPWDGKTPINGSNCQVWPNPAPAFPLTPCPVCGKYNAGEHPQFIPDASRGSGSEGYPIVISDTEGYYGEDADIMLNSGKEREYEEYGYEGYEEFDEYLLLSPGTEH